MTLLTFLFLFTGSSLFIPPDTDGLKKGIEQIYQTNFTEATTVFKTYQKRFPNRPEGYFLESMVVWWKVLLQVDSEQADSQFYSSIDKTIARLEELSNANRNRQVADYYIAGSYGFKARLLAIREKWLGAANNGRLSYPVLAKGLAGDYGFVDGKFGTGIYLYYAERVPEKYPIIKPIMVFFPDGDRLKGLSQLEEVMNTGYFTKYEAAWFLMQIYLNFESDFEKARIIGERLYNQFPKNPAIQLNYGNALFRTGKVDQAKEVFENYLMSIEAGKPYFWPYQRVQCSYFLGAIIQREKKPEQALAFYEAAIENYGKSPKKSQQSYYIESLLEAGSLYLRTDKKTKARQNFNLVLKFPNQFNWHQRAREGLKRLG